MDHAENPHITNPSVSSGVALTKKGERAVAAQAAARSHAIAEKRQIALTAAAEVERLLDLLDRLDGDPDLEPNGDEADQSYPESLVVARLAHGSPFEDAEESEATEDDGNAEPSLGAPEHHPGVGGWGTYSHAGSQTVWGHSATRDLEHDDEREDDPADMEPGLGWTDAEAASGRYSTMSGIIDGERSQ